MLYNVSRIIIVCLLHVFARNIDAVAAIMISSKAAAQAVADYGHAAQHRSGICRR